jgi:hypothetical protein
VTLWAIPPVTVRMRYPRPDTWFRRNQIDSVNQRMQHGRRQRNRGIQPYGLSLRPHEGEGVLGALQPIREFTTDHVKTLGPRKPDRRRSDCPALMLFCSRRIPEAILKSARNQSAVHTMTIGLEPFAIQLAPAIKPTRWPLVCHGCLHRF